MVVVSLLWAAWDPTYAKLQHAQQQSRHVRVQGKYVYRVSLLLRLVVNLLNGCKGTPGISMDIPTILLDYPLHPLVLPRL